MIVAIMDRRSDLGIALQMINSSREQGAKECGTHSTKLQLDQPGSVDGAGWICQPIDERLPGAPMRACKLEPFQAWPLRDCFSIIEKTMPIARIWKIASLHAGRAIHQVLELDILR